MALMNDQTVVKEKYKKSFGVKPNEGLFCIYDTITEGFLFADIPGFDRPRIFNRVDTTKAYIENNDLMDCEIYRVAYVRENGKQTLTVMEKIDG